MTSSGPHPAALPARTAGRDSLLARTAGRNGAERVLCIPGAGELTLAELRGLAPASGLTGARVALSLADPAALVRALFALDGRAEALLLVSYAQPREVVAGLAAAAGCTTILSDREDLDGLPGLLRPAEALIPGGAAEPPAPDRVTEWRMTTSGTTGLPKVIAHTLATLARTVREAEGPAPGPVPVWGLLYDPTRFAGMQVTLQGLLGGGRLVAIDTGAALADQVAALAGQEVTHLSATPTLWRRLLMAPGLKDLPLAQITLGGEIVNQDVLDALRAAFPQARLTHIYASTEAGVGFAVNDGLAGFPADFLRKAPGGVGLRLKDQILWLRPPGEENRPPSPAVEIDAEGFINSGDRVAEEEGRLVFLGRQNGTINVGGVKIHPEVVERVIGAVPGVRLARISARSSPITGALVVAEILPDAGADRAALKAAVALRCRERLEREAVPAMIRFVEAMDINAAGKLARAPAPTAPAAPISTAAAPAAPAPTAPISTAAAPASPAPASSGPTAAAPTAPEGTS